VAMHLSINLTLTSPPNPNPTRSDRALMNHPLQVAMQISMILPELLQSLVKARLKGLFAKGSNRSYQDVFCIGDAMLRAEFSHDKPAGGSPSKGAAFKAVVRASMRRSAHEAAGAPPAL
jgi:hypothetical protein